MNTRALIEVKARLAPPEFCPKPRFAPYRFIRILLVLAVLLFAGTAALAAALYPWPAFVLLAAVLVLRKKRPSFTAYGSATWAVVWQLRREKLIGGSGLCVGAIAGEFRPASGLRDLFDTRLPPEEACAAVLRTGRTGPALPVHLNTSVHTLCISPTGGGKSSGLVIPFLKANTQSAVVIDFSGELYRATHADRRRMGHEVAVLDPYRLVCGAPNALNPLDLIDRFSPTALDSVRDMAAALIVRKENDGRDDHWLDNAEFIASCMIAVTVAFADPPQRNLQAVRQLLANPDSMLSTIQLMRSTEVWDGMLARDGDQMLFFKDKELASSMTTVNRFFRWLDTPAVARCTAKSDFDPRRLLAGKMTVYCVIPPEHVTAQMGLLRLWIDAMLRVCVQGGTGNRHDVHFVLDETSSLGHLKVLEDAVDKFRKYRVKLQFYYQTFSQLKKCWPGNQEGNLLGNTTQVFLNIHDDPEAAKYCSDRLGDWTQVVSSGGRGTGTSYQTSAQGGSGGSSSNSSDNWQLAARKLLQPSEILALDERIAISFPPRVPPVWTTVTRWYERQPTSKKCGASAVKDLCQALLYLSAAAFLAFGLVDQATRKRPPVRFVFPPASKPSPVKSPPKNPRPLTKTGVKR